MLGAGVSGFILLGLTVLAVNAVLEHATAQRWRRATRPLVGALLEKVNTHQLANAALSIRQSARLYRQSAARGTEDPDWRSTVLEPLRALCQTDIRGPSVLARRLASDADALAPLLTAHDEGLDAYGAVWRVSQKARNVVDAKERHERAVADAFTRETSTWAGQAGVCSSIHALAVAYNDLMCALARLEDVSERDLGSTRRFQPVWSAPPVEGTIP